MKPPTLRLAAIIYFSELLKNKKGITKVEYIMKGINILCIAESESPLFLLALTAKMAEPPQFFIIKIQL
jgi:hypothetical protein